MSNQDEEQDEWCKFCGEVCKCEDYQYNESSEKQ